MIKNIIIAVLAIFCVLLVLFGYAQKAEAQKQKDQVAERQQIIKEVESEALRQQKIAEANAKEALRQRDAAVEAQQRAEECAQNSK